jgi:hypothetical protein
VISCCSTIHSVGSSRPLSASRHSQSELSVAEPHNESNLTAVAAALSAELPSGASEGDFNPNFVRIMRDLKRSERKAAEEAEKARIEELKQEAEARAAAAKAVAERARQREENDDGESDSTVPLSTDVVPISTPVMSPKTAPALPKSPNFALLFRPSTSSSSGRPQSSKQQLAVSSSVGNLHSQTWSKERMFPLGQSLSSLKQQHVKVAQPTLSQNPSYLSQQVSIHHLFSIVCMCLLTQFMVFSMQVL